MIRNIFYSSVVILRRKEFFKLTEKYCKHFDEMDTDEKLIWLMTNENIDILTQICQMIQDNGLRFFKFFFFNKHILQHFIQLMFIILHSQAVLTAWGTRLTVKLPTLHCLFNRYCPLVPLVVNTTRQKPFAHLRWPECLQGTRLHRYGSDEMHSHMLHQALSLGALCGQANKIQFHPSI